MKTPDYLSYERYKKKKNSNPNRRLLIFIVTFFASLLVFSVLAKSLTPDVDVTIGSDTELEEKDIGLGVKQFVDNRLKSIELDDLGKSLAKDKTSDVDNISVEEEKLTLPDKKHQKELIDEAALDPVMPAYTPPRPGKEDIIMHQTETPKMVKVYVGKYSTIDQAKVSQDILLDSGLDVSPFIKNLGGTYTLQIGSFADKSRAEQVASELTANGFPARMVSE